jgi:hypothetical protein
MKTIELPGGIPVFLSNLENKVYECMTEEFTCKEDLSERDVEIVQSLVNKGVCTRTQKDGKTYFSKTRGSL